MFDKYRPPGWSTKAEWVEPVTKNDHIKNLFTVMWISNKKTDACGSVSLANLNHKNTF